MAKRKNLCSDGTKAHHWIINSDNIGRCKKCRQVKDFNSQRNHNDTLPEWMTSPKRRGRPRKDATPAHV